MNLYRRRTIVFSPLSPHVFPHIPIRASMNSCVFHHAVPIQNTGVWNNRPWIHEATNGFTVRRRCEREKRLLEAGKSFNHMMRTSATRNRSLIPSICAPSFLQAQCCLSGTPMVHVSSVLHGHNLTTKRKRSERRVSQGTNWGLKLLMSGFFAGRENIRSTRSRIKLIAFRINGHASAPAAGDYKRPLEDGDVIRTCCSVHDCRKAKAEEGRFAKLRQSQPPSAVRWW
ncbi:hypothetical protein BaRGS_00023262 [Batillaria attramentaria]|uniref:Uncharacterized protein n=1 Tax=Batillaria attramentaria TaxID=370345 RepID=A0ABD0KEU7_9CAEN